MAVFRVSLTGLSSGHSALSTKQGNADNDSAIG
jgi:hypothetical protein